MLEMLALTAYPLLPPAPDRFIDGQALRTLQVSLHPLHADGGACHQIFFYWLLS